MFDKTKSTIIKILKDLSEWNREISGFMPPIWYCLTKTFADWKDIDINEFKFDDKVDSFLRTLNFYDNDCINNSKILPIRTIPNQDWPENDLIANEFNNLIKKFLWTWKENLVSSMYKILWELLNNIAHHSWEIDKSNPSQAYIFPNYESWQYFEGSNLIQMAIVDAWIWILSSVRKKKREIQTAEEAIKQALEPHFTWWTILNNNWISNAWLWLTVTLEIIKRLKWDIFIWTMDCLYSYNWNSWKEYYEKIPSWKWTFIVINVYTKEESNIDISNIRWKYLKNDEIFDLNLNFW